MPSKATSRLAVVLCVVVSATRAAARLPASGGARIRPPRIGVGASHACAVGTDGIVRCWGDDTDGQLGDGTTTQSTQPVQVIGVASAVGVAAGSHHTCALIVDGTIRCWGQNTFGQVGDGTTTTPRKLAVAVVGITNAIAVGAGRD